MLQELKNLARTMAKTISDMGYTREGHRMNHRHCLDVIAKTGGIKNWQAVVALKDRARPVLATQDEVLTCDEAGGTDFTMKPDVKSCWITVDGFGVHVIRTDEGVVVDILANRSGNIDAIAGTYAHHGDAEADVCEGNNINIDDVAEWVGLHYKVNFDVESGSKRYEWILRYIDSHTSRDRQESLEKFGYSFHISDFKCPYWVFNDIASCDFDSSELCVNDAWQDAFKHARCVSGTH